MGKNNKEPNDWIESTVEDPGDWVEETLTTKEKVIASRDPLHGSKMSDFTDVSQVPNGLIGAATVTGPGLLQIAKSSPSVLVPAAKTIGKGMLAGGKQIIKNAVGPGIGYAALKKMGFLD